MMTVKDLIENGCQSSPDGKHWEPALPCSPVWWRIRLRDAWAVWKGKAIAIRQTTKADIEPVPGERNPDCPHCRGMGYDASGYTCTCVEERK